MIHVGLADDEVSQVVWPWRQEAGKGGGATPADTRRSALIQSGVMVAVALLLRFVGHKPVFAAVVVGLACVVLFCGLFVPPAFRTIEAFGLRLGAWVGVGMTWVLLVPFFYLCFAVGHVVIAMAGRDPLHRAFLPQAGTYWTPRAKIVDPSYYRKQY
jgi:hypothetical protein